MTTACATGRAWSAPFALAFQTADLAVPVPGLRVDVGVLLVVRVTLGAVGLRALQRRPSSGTRAVQAPPSFALTSIGARLAPPLAVLVRGVRGAALRAVRAVDLAVHAVGSRDVGIVRPLAAADDVDRLGDRLQVVRAHAPGRLARVVNHEAVWDRADKVPVGPSVSEYDPGTVPEGAVLPAGLLAESPSAPDPAAVRVLAADGVELEPLQGGRSPRRTFVPTGQLVRLIHLHRVAMFGVGQAPGGSRLAGALASPFYRLAPTFPGGWC